MNRRPPRHSDTRTSGSSSAPRALALVSACALAQSAALGATFGEEVGFLKQYTDLIVLSDPAGKAKLVLAPAMQGRVLTSTAQGDSGLSFGWINRELIASREVQRHINVFGGEDRLWLGPEGGQFSIFFAKGAPFDLEHWYTPAPLDTEPFDIITKTRSRAEFRRSFALTNYSGTLFQVAVKRTVQLLRARDGWSKLGLPPAQGVDLVAFESRNEVRNAGTRPWTRDTGLLSIWILGMFNPSPATTIVIPFRPGPEDQLGKPVTSDYFGAVPSDRLVLKDNTIFFSGDGQFRSKIGISPARCKPVLGSYDAAHHVLTIVQFNFTPGESNYVNSKWEIQKHPFAGDVANSYNDGPPAPGAKPLGPFYEMESSSPAAALAPGKSLEHIHRTLHLAGPEPELDKVARATLGVNLQEITTALPRGK
jgi:hypothetical protein